MELSWVNGQSGNTVSIHDRGFLYGDGFFTTAAYKDGQFLLEDLHFQRLKSSAERLAFQLDMSQLKQEVSDFLSQAPNHGAFIFKIIISREQPQRGFAVVEQATINRVLQLIPYTDLATLESKREKGLKLSVAKGSWASQPMLAGIKHLSRLENVLLANQLNTELYQDALVFDKDDRLIESLMANVFCVFGKEVYTPDLYKLGTGVEGVMKACVKKEIANSAYEFSERTISRADIQRADAIFLTNCLLGLVHVSEIPELNWVSNKSLAQQFQQSINISEYAL